MCSTWTESTRLFGSNSWGDYSAQSSNSPFNPLRWFGSAWLADSTIRRPCPLPTITNGAAAMSPAARTRWRGTAIATRAADCEIDDDQRVKPCVPLFLVFELAGRNELLIRLIVLEYALRLRYDRCPPNPESYLPLCEQGGDQLIRLLELTENKLPQSRSASSPAEPLKHSDSTIKEASLSASITLDPLPLNLGCFLLVRLLGCGGMGYVHAAIEILTPRR